MVDLPFLAQEDLDACVPACLRMVLASFGIDLSEAELRGYCKTTGDGTLASDAVACLNDLGIEASAERFQIVDELAHRLGNSDEI